MQWFPSPEEDIAVATQEVGLTDQDVLSLFTTSQPELIRSEISAALSAEGFIVSEDRLDRKLAALEAKGKLVKLPATLTAEATYLRASAAKKKEKETSASEAILEFVHKAGGRRVQHHRNSSGNERDPHRERHRQQTSWRTGQSGPVFCRRTRKGETLLCRKSRMSTGPISTMPRLDPDGDIGPNADR
jgi:hypothetical protein